MRSAEEGPACLADAVDLGERQGKSRSATSESTVALMRVPLSLALHVRVANAVLAVTCSWDSPLGMLTAIESRRASW